MTALSIAFTNPFRHAFSATSFMSQALPIVLVISQKSDRWVELCECYSDEFEVRECTWEDISLTSYSDQGCTVILRQSPSSPFPQPSTVGFRPSLVVVRSLVRYISTKHGGSVDHRRILYGFVHSGVPLINGLTGIIAEQDRPLMYGGLREIERRLGRDRFPLIPQVYYATHNDIIITPPMPVVVKVSWPHAGYGKIRVTDYHDFDDLKSIFALHQDYVIVEPLIDAEYEVRIVFIAPDYYRVHQRRSLGWKVNASPNQVRDDMEMTPLYKLWCDEIRKAFGGLDMFAIDGIIAKDGRQYILEVNGSTQGFAPEHGDDYRVHMRELVASRLREVVGRPEEVGGKTDEELEPEVTVVNLRNRIDELVEQKAKQEKLLQPYVEEARKIKKVQWRWTAGMAVTGLVIGVVIGWVIKYLTVK